MKNREDILVVGKDGGYFYVDGLNREPKRRAETAFRTWLEENGEDGKTYILAKWLSHEMTINVKRTIVSSEPTTAAEPLVEESEFDTEAVEEVDPSSGQQDIQEEEPNEFPSQY